MINNEKFFEFAKDLLLPIILGSIIGLAIFLLNNIYRFLNHISLLLISHNSILIFASTLIAFLGGYLIIKLLADNKKCGCGTELVIESYHFRNGFLSLKDTISKTLASIITISFGGSAGLEGPSLLLGGGISSFITRKLGLNQKDLKKLFLCGAAAGFSAIFKAPLTGILLALEIPYKRDIETMVFVPASIASITAYFVSIATFGTETIFPSPMLLPIHTSILTSILIHAVILGVLAALIALIFVKVFEGINTAIERLTHKIPMLYITILGGLILGIIGLFYPEVLGLGYETICKMTTTELGNISLIMLIALLIFKIIATSITLNFGGSVDFSFQHYTLVES
ncbi:MAG: chloride channel protein [Candidatus Methanomethylicia archaeon]|nr:chloride channel protein [Candidatus Methanomethylicia archaeon]